MIGKGSKSSRNFGQWAWVSSALPWALTILFFATTVVFLTLYVVELDDDDDCDANKFATDNQQVVMIAAAAVACMHLNILAGDLISA